LRVRGAPAIGIAAAYGLVLALQRFDDSPAAFRGRRDEFVDYLAASRPTAVNLSWALERMRQCGAEDVSGMLAEAHAIREEDAAMCRAIGRHGAALLRDGDGVLTHCNTGGLATAEYGTALAAIFTAHEQGKQLRVFADETRPLLQGARLTTWELQQAGVDVTLICDSMAAQVMKEGRVQAVIVGADRIAANGDAANKIGTYGLAVLARAHDVPFYVAAPSSTFDLTLADGTGIPIEQRDPREVTHGFGRQTAPRSTTRRST
jgi:methylthioribose-1-phosphate isomerase